MRTKLRKRVMDKFGSVQAFARAMGCTRQTVSSMFSNANLSQVQILQACELLGIKRREILTYFFPEDVQIVKKGKRNVQ